MCFELNGTSIWNMVYSLSFMYLMTHNIEIMTKAFVGGEESM